MNSKISLLRTAFEKKPHLRSLRNLGVSVFLSTPERVSAAAFCCVPSFKVAGEVAVTVTL